MSIKNYTGNINNKWDEILQGEFEKEYFIKLNDFLETEYKNKIIYPEKENIFNALKFTPPDNVKVVILGQDPYINQGEAHGLAFSVNDGIKIPPSLRNIYKELNIDIEMNIPQTGNLISWAKQGVLLLNTVLTVESGKSNSHIKKGWEIFTDYIIKYLGERETPTVFILWGKNAYSKEKFITQTTKHLLLKSPHPSPLSVFNGFFGCKHFSQTNNFLHENGLEIIDWDSVNKQENKIK